MLTGALPVRSKWSLDFFAGPLGDTSVKVSLDGREKGAKAEMPLRDYIATFSGGEGACSEGGMSCAAGADVTGGGGTPSFKPYMRAWFFSDDHPELEHDFPNPPPYFPDKFKGLDKNFQPPFTWIFVGPAGAYSPLHRDIWFTCAWMAQFQGRKRFVFFPPKDLSKVYRKHEDKSEAYVDLLSPDRNLFPEFDSANAVECILEEGDVVYIPSKWPHFVECLTPSVSLTSNFANVANFKHVLVPYTRWLERRRMTIALVQKMKESMHASSGEDAAAAAGGGNGSNGRGSECIRGDDTAEEPEEEEGEEGEQQEDGKER